MPSYLLTWFNKDGCGVSSKPVITTEPHIKEIVKHLNFNAPRSSDPTRVWYYKELTDEAGRRKKDGTQAS